MSVLRLGSPRLWCGVVLLLAACGEEKQTPRDREPELPEGSVELSADDVGPDDPERRTGENGRANPERQADDLQLQTDPRDGAYEALLQAQDRELRARCDCRFEEFGQTSAQACFENLRRPDFARGCDLAAFSLNSNELGPRYACLAQARDESASCIEAAGCAGLSECEATRDTARGSCGPAVYADVTFAEFADGCQRLTRLGVPSGCPDVVPAGTALGSKVFTGNTTGSGDDVTLSCHWDFDNFESPDLLVEWQAPAAGVYRFSTENSGFVTQLGILDGCGGAELACASSNGSSFGGAELLLSLDALQTVVVVLEGYSLTDSGYVALSVNPQP
jgi:hypothetical protein